MHCVGLTKAIQCFGQGSLQSNGHVPCMVHTHHSTRPSCVVPEVLGLACIYSKSHGCTTRTCTRAWTSLHDLLLHLDPSAKLQGAATYIDPQHVYVHTHTHLRTHTHKHANTHTHIHTHKRVCVHLRSLMAFVNVPMIWPKLEVVRMVSCNMPDFDEEVDYAGLGELLLRSRIKVLEMTHTHLGDSGCVFW